MKYVICLAVLCIAFTQSFAQQETTSVQIDTVRPARIRQQPAPHSPIRVDTTVRTGQQAVDSIAGFDSVHVTQPVPNPAVLTPPHRGIDTFYQKLLNNPYFNHRQAPLYLVISERNPVSKDQMFYLLSGLVLFLAFIRLIFSRYFINIFRLFFQPSFRQKQTREQLLQSNLPSFFLNIFFVFSAGAYVALLTEYFQLSDDGFWKLFFYSSAGLLLLYVCKYLVLSFAGWVFGVSDATDTYSFIVFLINKIMGVLLVPFILLIAFSQPQVITMSVTISMVLIGILFLYRYVAAFNPVMREIRVDPGHFLLYIAAIEIIPMLLIYKTLVNYLYK